MILWYRKTRRALYVAPFVGTISSPHLEPFPGEGEVISKSYLVLRNPMDWLLSFHQGTMPYIPFQLWYRAAGIHPQSALLPSPSWVIRAEHFEKDMMTHLGIEAHIALCSPSPRNSLCPAVAAQIRRSNAKDYSLGGYE